MYDLLKEYNLPEDLKKLSHKQLKVFANKIRKYIIDNITQTGGHLASSLGVVDLTLALHTILNSPEDKIIWDVGHQCYPHKLLTGRDIKNIRKYNGLSGFPLRTESKHDIFGAGHASTSISSALGIAHARDLKREDFAVFAVIGDSALSGGLAFEGLNNANSIKGNFVVILNDNEMSISEPVGALSKTITGLRLSKLYTGLKKNTENLLKTLPFIGKPLAHNIERMVSRTGKIVIHETSTKEISGFFQDLGFTYIGPINGHNIPLLMSAISYAKKFKKGPLLIHVKTKKGFGYQPAEENPTKYHGISDNQSKKKTTTYTETFGNKLCELASNDKRIVAITAAMLEGTGLKKFKNNYPKRFFDIGIAEGHAVTFAGGLAVEGMRPFVAIYSSFLQRAYDQIIHDIALQELPVTFIIDRAGIVGEDGPTHHGAFDISFLRTIPNIIVSTPKDQQELEDLMVSSLEYNGPFAIRFPKGEAFCYQQKREAKILKSGSWEILSGEINNKIIIIACGRMVATAHEAIQSSNQTDICLINARFIKPLDEEMLDNIKGTKAKIIILEEGSPTGGLSDAIHSYLFKDKIVSMALPDRFIGHGNTEILLKEIGLSKEAVLKEINND